MVIAFNDNHLGALVHFRREVIETLAKKGNDIILIAPESDERPELPTNVRLISVKMNRTSMGLFDCMKYLNQLNIIFKQCNPDIVFNFTIKPIIFGGIICKFRKIKSVAFFAGVSKTISNLSTKSSVKSKLIFSTLRSLLNWNYKSIFLNDSDIKFMRHNDLIDKSKIVLFPGGEGVDVIKYAPIEAPELPYFKVVMISRVLKTKGYHEFVRAGEILKNKGLNIRLFLAGGIDDIHPDRITEVEIQQDSDKGIFTYMGHLNNLPDFIKDADCIVLPSYYNEGMNRSLMESLSMGIPIVTTDNRGCRELVKDAETGYIIPARDSKALADAIIKIYSLPEEVRQSFKSNSRRYALERFDVRDVICKYEQIINGAKS